MADRPLRLAGLSVLGGPLHGRRHDLEEVVTEVLIGSDADCHLHVDLPSISPIHARLWTDLNGAIAHDTRAPRGLFVNVRRVEDQAPVREGDVLWLGPPQESGSVCIQCHFEPWVEVLPEAPVAADAAGPPPVAAVDEPPAILPEAQEPMLLGEGLAIEATEAEPEPTVVADKLPPPAPGAPPSPPAPPEPASPGAPAPLESEPAAEPEAESAEASSAPVPGPAPTPAAVLPEDDPFFLGDAGGITDAGGAAPAGPEPALGAGEEPAPAAAGDEWFFGGAPQDTPPPPGAAPPPAPAAPSAPPSEVAPVEDFFIAEDAVVFESGPAVAPVAPALPEPGPISPPAPPGPAGGGAAVPPAPRPLDERAPPPPRQAGPAGSAPPGEGAPAPSPSRATLTAPSGPATPPVAQPEVPTAPPTARRAPSPARPARAPSRRASASSPRRAPRRPRSGPPTWLRPAGLGLLALAAVAAVGFGLMQWFGRTVQLDEVSPSRLRVGQRAILLGSGFSDEPAENAVAFGDKPAKVLEASATRLEVEVPEAVAEAGAERRVPVVVRRGSREAAPIEVSVFQGPRLHGLSPDVAMPGEEVLLAGAGWGLGATVRFGESPASVVEADASQIRAIVPPLPGGPGTAAPVVVTVGGIESNPAPFFVGRLPLVVGVEPASASAGDVLTVSGRGFERDRQANDVRIGGRPALVVSAFADELRVVVPRVAAGASVLELRTPGSSEPGQTAVQVRPPADPVRFEFVAEPFPGPPERPHAVLGTALGPAFVLAAATGRSAAERALEAQQRLNGAAAALASSPGLVPEARDLATRPVIGLAGRSDVLLEVTAEDAAAYDEDWTRLRGRGGPVTPARLARWWEAVARDLALLLIRNERPRFAAALASEGRALGAVFDAARASGRPGVPADVVAAARPSVRDGLRLVALRVPAAVTAAFPVAAGAAPAATPTPQRAEPLRLEGTWAGSEDEGGQRRYLSVRFRRNSGSVSYEGGITLTMPFLAFDQPRRDQVRFTVEFRGGLRHYIGQWDGETLRGDIARDEAGRNVVGSFELRPR